MPRTDLFPALLALDGVADLVESATAAIARVHRRPAGLRKYEVISAESLARGARSTALFLGVASAEDINSATVPGGGVDKLLSAYSVLAPAVHEATVRDFARAPLHLFSRLDVVLGGDGIPAAGAGSRISGLGALLADDPGHVPGRDALLPVVAHAEIASRELFGERSEALGRVVLRTAAVHTGLDPRGFAVPEPYLLRHKAQYQAALRDFAAGQPGDALRFLLRALVAGAKEADGITQAL